MRREIEDAHSFKVGLCDDQKCHALHFHLADEDGEVFAGMTIGIDYIPAFIEKVRALAYEIEVLKKDY